MFPVVHVLALWAIAVAQPVYDILGRNGEFFIAHRTQPVDLLLFAATVSLALPLILAVPYMFAARWWPRAARPVLAGLVAVLSAALVSQIMAFRVPLPAAAHFAVGAAGGAAAAWLYVTKPLFRSFLTVLSVGVLLFPALFLMQPSMAPFVRTHPRHVDAAATIAGEAPPVVVVVFDQLPLTSLLGGDGRIDRARYPGFAALGDTATWYRNASTVADFTGWAVPPILTGLQPRRNQTPTVQSYPFNLFTWLGGRYRLEVQEPITQLCPERLCTAARDPAAVRLGAMMLDSSVVYATAVSPASVRARLPPLTENWKDFIDNQRWQRRWVNERQDDRRRVPQQLIESISRDDPQPTLYFAHTLLPHEPYVYLRSGQTFTDQTQMAGLKPSGRWTSDPWPVTLAYRRHLLQLGFVDGVVARLIERLKSEGLYDRALVVVTSDHGASFRPGLPFKGLNGETVVDMVAVPLFIKAPGQRQGVIDDRNVQSIDVMPTIAHLLGVPLTWQPDGREVNAPRPETKTVFHMAATRQIAVDPAWLATARQAAAARKIAMFGDESGWPAPAASRRDLIGTRLADVTIVEGPWQATVDMPDAFVSVSRNGPHLPAMITGDLRDATGRPADARVDVAIAIGGEVAAVTRTFHGADAEPGSWAALVDPARLKPGRNDIQVLVLSPDNPAQLQLAYASRGRPERIDLASRGAHDYWRVQQTGFYRREGEPIPHRWTSGDATLSVPLESDEPPRSLRVGLAAVRPGGSPLKITLNGCTLFSGTVATAPWYESFSLRACPDSALHAPEARITIETPSWKSGEDGRPRGVAVEAINLFQEDWPLTDAAPHETRAAVRTVKTESGTKEAGTAVEIELSNIGKSIWVPARLDRTRAVQIALRWRAADLRGPEREQRLDLPWPLYPTDRTLIDAPLVPPAGLAPQGPWKVTIAPVRADGTTLPVDEPLVMTVIAAQH